MKRILSILSVCALAVSFAGLVPQSAQADSQRIYTPVKTQQQLDALKPNTSIAITCPDCGMVVVTKVKKDRSNLSHFDCSVCKHSFEITTGPGGKSTIPKLVCRDSKGHTMPLHLCAEMH